MAGTPRTIGFTVSRPEWTAGGKRHRSPRYHVRFRDHHGVWRRLVAFTDADASAAFGRKLRELTDLTAAGERPRGDLAAWVNELDGDVLAKLSEWGILDAQARRALLPLADHVETWQATLLDSGRTQAHADLHRARVERVVSGCGFGRFADVTAEAVETYLAKLRRKGTSTETTNHYVRAVKQFGRWMHDTGRAAGMPLAGLKTLNARTDRRRVRRALTVDELQRLLQATENGKDRGRLTGPMRATIYWLAAETGLRANEIRTLTRSSFDLDGDRPTVTVSAADSKHRREDVLPIRPELASRLRTHFEAKLPGALAFFVPDRTADMLRDDLRLAGIDATDDAGDVLDFHALRATFITNLVRGGVHPRVAQTLARHGTMELTMSTYTKLGAAEHRTGVDVLPDIQPKAATGIPDLRGA